MSGRPTPRPAAMPPGASLWRRARTGLQSALGLFQAGAFSSGGVGRHRVASLPFFKRRWHYTVREPELIREILVNRAGDFPKSVMMDDMLRELIGSSAFVINGETWRWKRAILDAALQQARVRQVFARMREAADAALDRLEAAARAGPVAVDVEMTHFAADVIFRTLFSEPIPGDDVGQVIRSFEAFQGVAYAHAILRQSRLPVGLLPGAWRMRRAARAIRAILDKPLERRMAAIRADAPRPANDIVASLARESDPATGRAFDRRDLLDEVAMLFLAGHETSANALAWSLYLLAANPDIQDEARREATRVLAERAPDFADMKALNLIRDVFREALRLYPPVAVIARDATCPEYMAGRDIAPGAVLYVAPWIMHRQARFWDRPEVFDPARFETEAGKQAVRSAYLPFSIGPRVCPGAAFALQEATLVLAMLLRRFRFEVAPGHTPSPIARLTLGSANGVRLVVTPMEVMEALS